MTGKSFMLRTLKNLTKGYPSVISVVSEAIDSEYDPVTGVEGLSETTTNLSVLELPLESSIYIFPTEVVLTVGSKFFGIDANLVTVSEGMKILSGGEIYNVTNIIAVEGTQYVLTEMIKGAT